MGIRSPLLRCGPGAMASLLLGGCAALQIDVDVYKGPLANNEEIQQQQVISMALSAKVLMMTVRNQFIEAALAPATTTPTQDEATSNEVDKASGTFKRLRCVPAKPGGLSILSDCQPLTPVSDYDKAKRCFNTVYSRAFLVDLMPNPPEQADKAIDERRKNLRMAIQLNDLLTFYPNKGGLSPAFGAPCAYTGVETGTGYDANRDEDGIEALANDLLEKNRVLKNVPSGTDDTAARHAAEVASAKMERVLADLASRMQFLATNQWLIEKKDDGTERYKALFEVVANTILLHVDDIQNRRRFKQAGMDSAAAEWEAVHKTALGGSSTISKRKKSIEVMDELIAQLRHQHLQALMGGKESSDAAAAIGAALAEARKQRALMIYLRPSSAYLRSVFATTYTQQSPDIAGTNLLNERLKDFLHLRDESKDVRRTRSDLDKVFWQNINTVRVSGAGSTNFVIAKDDVGNWYVKSMGADPEEMIKAVTNTALYSYSGKIDTNLLRVAELRNRIDTPGLSDAEYERARRELNDFNTGSSGPAAAAHGKTWSLFEENYRLQGSSQFARIRETIRSDALTNELTRRWTLTLQPLGATDSQALIAALLSNGLVPDAKKKMTASVEPADPKDPGEALVGALEALARYHGALREQVVMEKVVTGAVAQQLAVAETARRDGEQLLETALGDLANAEKNLAAAEKAEPPVSAATLEAVRAAHRQARTQADVAAKTLTARRAAAVAARDALDAANARHDALLTDLDTVTGQFLRTEGGARVRANEEMETTIRVLGRSVSPAPVQQAAAK